MIDPSAAADIRRRARNLVLFGTTSALAIGVAATQFVAWKLSYDPALGPPIVAHAYWPWRFIQWWQAPWETQVASTFALVKLGLLGTLCAGLLLLAKAGRKQPRPQPTIHGTARVATEAEIREAGLLPRKGQPPKPGIIAGGWTHRNGALSYLTYRGEGHVLCLGPTRCGKTAAIIVPTLLTWPESAVVYDTKGELWRMTAGWRHSEAGNTVMRFAPGDEANTVHWNPFDRVRRGTAYLYRDTANIIEQIADPKGKGLADHWEPSAANFMLGVALYLLDTTNTCSLTAILTAIDSGADITILLNDLAANGNPQVAEVGRGMLATAARERASIVSTARRLLRLYRDPVVARNTATSNFRIEDLMNAERPVSLYIETRGEDELRLRPLVRLFLSLTFGQIISTDGNHRHRLLAVIDEVATLGEMEPLELALSKVAGSSVNALLACQDYEQLLKTYGQHEGLTAHCDVLIAHAPRNAKTAEWLSERTGKSTVVVEEVSESLDANKRRTQSRTFRSVPRPVLTPDEVARLKPPERDAADRITAPGELLVLQGGRHVVIGTQSLAFRDPEFQRRMAIPAPAIQRVRP